MAIREKKYREQEEASTKNWTSKPPANASNEERSTFFRKAMLRGRLAKHVWFKLANGDTEEIRIQILTQSEQHECELNAMQWVRKGDFEITGDVTENKVYQERLATEVLAKALTVKTPIILGEGREFYRPDFMSADELRECLIDCEVDELIALYNAIRAEFEPDYTLMIDENFQQWMEFLAKAPEEDARLFLARFASLQPVDFLPEICRRLLVELYHIHQSLISSNLENTSELNQMKFNQDTFLSTEVVSNLSKKSKKKQKAKQSKVENKQN